MTTPHPNRVLVTGATGFIGAHLVRALLHDPAWSCAEVRCLVRDPAKVAPDLAGRTTLLAASSRDLDRCAAAIRECDVVFHVAARATFGYGAVYEEDNVGFTSRLLGLLRRGPIRRFVFTSTIGAVDRRPVDPCTHLLTEDTPPHPLSDYGKSKLECERLVTASGLPFAIARPTWVYGPGMREKSHIRHFIRSVELGKAFTRINFPGRVSLVHVADMAKALLLLGSHPQASGGTFFATDGAPRSIGKILQSIGSLVGRPAGHLHVPRLAQALFRKLRPALPLAAQNLFSDVLCADNAKLRALGFSPAVTFEEGLPQTIAWHWCQATPQPTPAAPA